MIVDAHVHVFKRVSPKYPRDLHPMFPADMEVPVERLLETLERQGVDKAVLVPLSPHDEYLRECLLAYPETFACIGVLDHTHPADRDALRSRVDAGPLKGLRLHHLGDANASRPEELTAWPALQLMAELDLILWFYSSTEQMRLLVWVLDRLPQLRVVLNHLGCPMPEEVPIDVDGRPRIEGPIPPPTLPIAQELASHPRVYVMFSGHYGFSSHDYPYLDLKEVSQVLYHSFGAQRMLWASDFPWILKNPGYGRLLSMIDYHLEGISTTEREAIMGETAARLFGFSDMPRSSGEGRL